MPEVKLDSSDCQIATINPFRYRSYYYDEEIELYYLQSRYYDAQTGKFINGDDTETISLESIGTESNLFIYCSNSPVNDEDDGGALSFNTIKKVISDFINSVFKAAVEELKNVFIITKKSLEVKNSVIAAAIDGLIMLISAAVAFLTKSAIKIIVRNFLLKRTSASQKFIRFLIDLLLKPGIVGVVVALIGFICRWTKYKINAFTSDVIQNLLNAKTKLLRNVYAIYTAISSVGSFIAFCLDLFDGDPNGYLKIKFA